MPDYVYDFWCAFAENGACQAAPVEDFAHAPAALGYGLNVRAGMLVEVAYFTSKSPRENAYWLATVVFRFGYLTSLRWLGYGDDASRDFLRNIAYHKAPPHGQLDLRVLPVGWCKKNNKPRHPPGDMQLCVDWSNTLEDQSAVSLPADFHEIVKKDIECCFKPGTTVELSDARLAVVKSNIERRIHFRYIEEERSVWFHEFSHMFFPCGWGHLHGRRASPEYSKKSRSRLDDSQDEANSLDCHKPIFIPDDKMEVLKTYRFQIGDRLEVVNPMEPSVIGVGTILRVLKNQYLILAIGKTSADDTGAEICLHATSPYLLPAGFAAENGLSEFFRAPHAHFAYEGGKTVPKEFFHRKIFSHNLRTGQFLEVVSRPGSNLICVARIERIVGHLLRIRFEGDESVEDQFFPISSPDIYPVGWCHAMGHPLITPIAEKTNDGSDKLGARGP